MALSAVDSLLSTVNSLDQFATPEFLNLVRNSLEYIPTGDLSDPSSYAKIATDLTKYAAKQVYDPALEQRVVQLLGEDLNRHREKQAREESQNLSSNKGSDYNVIPRVQLAQPGPVTLRKFEPLRHVALIGSTTAGKTTFMIRMLLDDKFADYDQFVLSESGIKGETVTNIEKAAQFEVRIKNKGQIDDKFMVYYKSHDVDDVVRFCLNEDKDRKKLVFFDDIQVIDFFTGLHHFLLLSIDPNIE